jgi:EAL domain-containing protein (putative c-di-GMP-specific phosphodiesterase class I)
MAIFTRTGTPGEEASWLRRLRRALEEDLFVLHFQPIVALADGRLAQQEALLRLADEPEGLVAPARFLPHAERSGLIREIDRMVLAKALELVGAGVLSARPDSAVRVAVNLSAHSITDPTLRGFMHSALACHQLDPDVLVLELTETAAITDMAAARSFCAWALELGCGIALDDFGSGYVGLQYLKHLPFSHLKIDGEFIQGLAESRTDQAVVQALVGLASAIGCETVAECVGDSPTREILRSIGVDYAQGFGIGRPQPLLALAA